MMKWNQKRTLTLLLVLLILALAGVAGYILWQQYQYSESDAYYNSLRNTGRMLGVRKL